MTHSLEPTAQELRSLPVHTRQEQKLLLKVFWLIALGLFVFEFFLVETSSFADNLGAISITVAALLPSYLWCSGRALGMPIFPLFALTFIWTYALPLVSNHPKVITYSVASHLFASFTVTVFLGIGTTIWFQFVKLEPLPPQSYRAINSHKGNNFFLLSFVVGILFYMSSLGGWFVLEPGIYSIVRSTVLGLTTLSTFVLAHNLGTQDLPKVRARLFVVLISIYLVTSAVGLTIVAAASTFLVATIAFIIGRKKIPILTIIIFLICLSLLHSGKSEMREKYWGKIYIQPWDYPSWYAEWIGYSLDNQNKQNSSSQSPEKTSLLNRSSLVHMLMLAQNNSPDHLPFLEGKTYEILPQVIVPRIFNPNRIWTHEGTYLLNIHYGLQTREETLSTTIGWGLLAESYANFGLIGCGGLAIFLGIFYGQTTRLSLNTTILSDRSLFAVLILTFSFQTEWTAGVYVAALSQASIVLCGIIIFLMKTYKTPSFPVLTRRA